MITSLSEGKSMCRKALLMCIVILMTQALYADVVSVKTKIAYVKDGYVYVCGEDGTDAVKVSPKGNYSSLRWSPDGKHIACIDGVASTTKMPHIMNINSTGFVAIQGDELFASIPSWAPDSKSLLFGYSSGARMSDIYIYEFAANRLKSIHKLKTSLPLAPTFISVDVIAYADFDTSSIVIYNIRTGKSKRIRISEDILSYPIEMIAFADYLVVMTLGEGSPVINPVLLKPGSASWFTSILKRLEKPLSKSGLIPMEINPGAEGKTAYVMASNDDVIGNGEIPQSRAYKLDAQGSHLLFSVTSAKYSIHEVSPLEGSRIIYLRLRSLDPRIGDLRIYDLNTKTSKTLVGDVSTSAVWPRR